MTVLFTPIDIEFELPSEQELIDWYNSHKMLDTDYWEYTENRHQWCLVASRENHTNWREFIAWQKWTTNRNLIGSTELFFHDDFELKFPSLANAIRQLPFKEIGATGFIRQMGAEIEPHMDTDNVYGFEEPRRYVFFVSKIEDNTFFMYPNNNKVYPIIHPKYRLSAFNNTACEHGADSPRGWKMLLSTTGILDKEKHEALIKRSIEKFSDYVIRKD